MNKTQQALMRINILICQIAESIENGDVEMGYVRKSTDEIEKIILDISFDKPV